MLLLPVAGNSPILRSLVDEALAVSPWFQPQGDRFVLDWDAVLPLCAAELPLMSQSGTLLEAAKRLVPSVPMPLFRTARTFQYSDTLNVYSVAGPRVDLDADTRKALAALGGHLTALRSGLRAANRASQADHYLEAVNARLLDQIDRCLWLKKLDHFETSATFSFHVAARFAASQGHISAFLGGGDRSSPQSGDHWQLTRALVAARLEIFHDLTAADESSSLRVEAIFNGISRLARHEARLSAAVSSKAKLVSTGLLVGFMDDQGRSLHSSPGETLGSSPYEALSTTLQALRPNWNQLRVHVEPRFGKSLINKAEVAADAVASLCRSMWQDQCHDEQQTSLTADLAAAFDWAIAHTPLLTLLASGFLATFPAASAADQWGLCLSPWLAANVLAETMLGAKPLEYGASATGASTADGPDEDFGDAGVPLLPQGGRGIWELARRHRPC